MNDVVNDNVQEQPNPSVIENSSQDEGAIQTSPPGSGVRHPVARVIDEYVQSMRGIGETATIVLPHISKWLIDEIDKTEEKLRKFIPDGPKLEEIKITLDSARDIAEFSNTMRQLEDLRVNKAPSVLARSLFMQMFSTFDAYTGALLKVIYLKNDELLKGISREISLSDLLGYADINSVKRAMLEKEIETFRRDSYVEQFLTLEKKFNLPLRKFKEWGEFVELSQRRNLYTHNDGIVSEQYLLVCDREGHKFDVRPKLGEALQVNIDYFFRALRLLSKVGLMLGYTLWSKVFPKECDHFHESLNNTLYKSLIQKRWWFVAELEDFVFSDQMRRSISEIDNRIRLINVAIALKFIEKTHESCRLLHSVDWTASYRDFKLAIAVIEDRYADAVVIMESIGKSGEIIHQPDYHTWPLFTKFREYPEFYVAYEKIYGESFFEKLKPEIGLVEVNEIEVSHDDESSVESEITGLDAEKAIP